VDGAAQPMPSGARWALGALVAAVAVAAGGALGLALNAHPLPSFLLVGGTVGAIALLVITLARYELAVALGFALLPVVRVEPSPADVVFGVVILVAALTGRLTLRRLPLAALGLVFGFLAINALSVFQADDVAAAGRFVAITVYLGAFGLWVAAYVDSQSHARRLVVIYVTTAAGFAFAASAALFVAFPGHELLLGGGGFRAQGLFKDPNVFGPFLVPPALILLEELITPRLLSWSTATKLLTLCVLVAGVVFSYSRAAWLNFLLASLVLLIVVAMRRRGARRALVILMFLLSAGLFAYGVLVLTGSTSFLRQRAEFQVYDVQRFSVQRGGVQLGEHHPIGIGPGQFEIVAPRAAHSTYVRMFAEQGPLGLALGVALLLATLAFAVSSVRRGRGTHGIGSATLLAAWVGLLANSFFVDTLHWRHLWLVAGLIWAGAMIGRRGAAGVEPRRRGHPEAALV
jgi:hypothetical protein